MTAGDPAVPTRWEQAHQAFQTPEEEVAKILRRFRSLGADSWDKRSSIADICSGRGAGLRAWHRLGFGDVVGVDFSLALAATHRGPGRVVLGDARHVPLRDASRDIVMVQGGLHHLSTFDDMDQALGEMVRVVRPGGRIVVIEPWPTPFLRFVNAVALVPAARRLSRKMDAYAVMYEEERVTYDAWLARSKDVLAMLTRHIAPSRLVFRWGKVVLVGSPATSRPPSWPRPATGRTSG